MEPGTSRLECSSCGHTGRLDAHVVQAAASYQKRVRQELSRSDEQSEVARRYAGLSGGWSVLWFVPLMVLLPLCALAMFGTSGAGRSGSAGLLMVLLFGALVLGFVGTFVGTSRKSSRHAASSDVGGDRCRYCGAPTQFGLGSAVARCGYCHASLLASRDTMTRGVNQAARAARMAKVGALHSERQWSIRLAKKSRILLAVARFSPLAVFLVAGMAFFMGDSPESRENALVAWGFCGLVALGIGTGWLWKAWHIRRAARVAEALVERFGGRAVVGVPALVEWLDLFWSDEFPVYRLSSAAEAPAVACAVQGFPALVIINPMDKNGTIELLLSAWYEGRSELGQGPEAKRTKTGRPQLLADGFEVHAGPCGIRASMTRTRTAKWLDLGQTLVSMAEMARAQGGQPQEPLAF